MCRILIFGGTTEGRLLAEFLNREKIGAWISVASEYGEEILKEEPNESVKILKGRMDRYKIEQFIRKYNISLVIDATHPHARLVSEEIKDACNKTGIRLERCIRSEGKNTIDNNCVMVDSIQEAVSFLSSVTGVIFATTGSKELENLRQIPDYQKRIYARVLPTSTVLKKCEDLGITGHHLIAMQGPFSTEMNVLFLKQTKADWLLTKDSGTAGGFQEKIQAAREAGTRVVVIRRPLEYGITLKEAMKVILEEASNTENIHNVHNIQNFHKVDNIENKCYSQKTHIILAGIGMGRLSQMTFETVKAIRESDAIIGAGRMLESAKNTLRNGELSKDSFKNLPCFYKSYLPNDVMQIIAEHPEWRQAVILYSGDTGFFSGAAKMSEQLKQSGYSFEIYPGISCVSYMAARLGINWEDAAIYSSHGRKLSVSQVMKYLSDPNGCFKKAFILMGGKNGAGKFCRELTALGYEDTFAAVGENLSYENERILSGDAKELSRLEFDELSLLFIDTVGQQPSKAICIKEANNTFPHIMFAAPKSGSGKTLITCGFLEILLRRKLKPLACKCGPDYIDPMFHRYVLGIPGRNLDSFFLNSTGVKNVLANAVDEENAGIAVLEGVMGYYDGLGGTETDASSWEIADITKTPAILVLDCKGASLSAAATAKGFVDFKENSHIKGIILNRVSPMYYDHLAKAIEKSSGIPVLGYLPDSLEYRMESRHLGLFMPGEIDRLKERIKKLADTMEKSVAIDKILEIAGMTAVVKTGQSVEISKQKSAMEQFQKAIFKDQQSICIGVAHDEAFCFYYQENLRLLEEMGAKLVYFSPLRDSKIPDNVDGLIFGGGYPENYAKELSENAEMLSSVRHALDEGMPFLAECGGFLYLHQTLEGSDGKKWKMAGVYPFGAYKTDKLRRFGYVRLITPLGREIHGHEFHYWESENPGTDWEAVKPTGNRSWRCVHANGAQIGGFPHLYYPSCPEFLSSWLKKCRG